MDFNELKVTLDHSDAPAPRPGLRHLCLPTEGSRRGIRDTDRSPALRITKLFTSVFDPGLPTIMPPEYASPRSNRE
jgi:hypothetical protein